MPPVPCRSEICAHRKSRRENCTRTCSFHGRQAKRKPRLPSHKKGSRSYRPPTTQNPAPTFQPPRRTRLSPEAAPVGSVTSPDFILPCQSKHHSHTFPLISFKPNPFSPFFPTGCVFPSALPLYHATAFVSSSSFQFLFAPLALSNLVSHTSPYLSALVSSLPCHRAAYSHSASVGSRYHPHTLHHRPFRPLHLLIQ